MELGVHWPQQEKMARQQERFVFSNISDIDSVLINWTSLFVSCCLAALQIAVYCPLGVIHWVSSVARHTLFHLIPITQKTLIPAGTTHSLNSLIWAIGKQFAGRSMENRNTSTKARSMKDKIAIQTTEIKHVNKAKKFPQILAAVIGKWSTKAQNDHNSLSVTDLL